MDIGDSCELEQGVVLLRRYRIGETKTVMAGSHLYIRRGRSPANVWQDAGEDTCYILHIDSSTVRSQPFVARSRHDDYAPGVGEAVSRTALPRCGLSRKAEIPHLSPRLDLSPLCPAFRVSLLLAIRNLFIVQDQWFPLDTA